MNYSDFLSCFIGRHHRNGLVLLSFYQLSSGKRKTLWHPQSFPVLNNGGRVREELGQIAFAPEPRSLGSLW